jgi:hypothetical protein
MLKIVKRENSSDCDWPNWSEMKDEVRLGPKFQLPKPWALELEMPCPC